MYIFSIQKGDHMKKSRHSLISLMLSLVMLVTMCAGILPADVSAAETVTKTVNIAEATKNERGPGYDWANRFDILTLNNLRIETSDAYGLRLPKNATVVLKGNNYIKAAKYGVSFSGTEQQKWLHEHCYEYGFIVRFPKDKEKITGFLAESWHFRYVGVEAAQVMTYNNWCLEEYIEKMGLNK